MNRKKKIKRKVFFNKPFSPIFAPHLSDRLASEKKYWLGQKIFRRNQLHENPAKAGFFIFGTAHSHKSIFFKFCSFQIKIPAVELQGLIKSILYSLNGKTFATAAGSGCIGIIKVEPFAIQPF
jgi:hypothetical protein